MNPSLVSILSFALLFLSLAFPSLSERCDPNDKKALLEIKKALGNPYALITWDPKTDCCVDWNEKNLCDDKSNRVTSLNLFKIDEPGYLSPAIGDLPYLTDLDINNVRNLSGPIPLTIVKLSKLTFLRISQTNISGPVPDVLSKLTKVTYINLSYNKLEGPIPPSLSELSNLEFLRLDRNKLIGTIPESLSKLARKKLTYLYLGHNMLTGVVPKSFAGWSFDTIDLSRNMLEGDISFLFGKDLTTFEMLLDHNKFEFDFSKTTYGKNLVRLDLNHNKIYGSLPAALTKQEWQLFNVSYNRLCGKIPQGGRLQSNFDQYTYFHNKCLCDSPLPPCKS